ncbi:MAG: flagellar biosynthesis protein FlhB [Parvularculaceae bacterium]
MSDTDNDDKSFEPTQSRIEKARREGDTPLSKEIASAAAYIGLYGAIVIGADFAAQGVAMALASLHDRPESFSPTGGTQALQAAVMAALAAAAVFIAAPAAAVATALALQQNVVFAPQRLKMKWSRLSPIANAKHKYGPDGIAEFLRSFTIVGLILAMFLFVYRDRFEALPGAALAAGEAVGGMITLEAALLIGAISLFSSSIGAVDLVWVRARHRKKLMMSLDEIRREAKETEGDPHFKSARRERAKALATNKMLKAVPGASVLLVNPEHYAVALRWDGPSSGPPVCVAKGADNMAAKIKEIAAQHGVPIHRDPPAARAIYSVVGVGEEIRREHFAAVAAAIHFADLVRKKARDR